MTTTIEDAAAPVSRLRCSSCYEYWEDGENTSPLYECGECGERFTRNNATYGNHQCSCGRFASKVAEEGCDDCDEECEEVSAWECSICLWVCDDEAAMIEHFDEELAAAEKELAEEPQQPQQPQAEIDAVVEVMKKLFG